jgi:hypothetical protein
MDVMVRPFMMIVLFTASVACACSRASPTVRGVAIIGDSRAELQSGISAAEAARKNPLFVVVRVDSRVHLFSPYAQLVRSDRALVVRAFSSILTFPLTASVEFDGKAVDVASLPHVAFSAPAGARLNARDFNSVTDAWNGLKDPWQGGQAFPPWTKGAILDAQSTELSP